MKFLKLLVIYTGFITTVFAQFGFNNGSLPTGLSLSNQLEYSHDTKRKIEIMENWLNLDYRSGIFSAGFRFDAFQPNDPDPSISRGKDRYAGIDYKYISARLGKGKKKIIITAGNFYSLFGRGIILKSYEDRSIRVDNNLLGIKVNGQYKNLEFTLLSGSAENSLAQRKDILHAGDLTYKFGSILTLGSSYALNLPAGNSEANTSVFSLRAIPHFRNMDLYLEYGLKLNEDIRKKYFENKEDFVGKSFYANLNYFFKNLSFSGEYKYYDNFAFTSADGSITYNTPPSLRKDYSFTLLNRNASTFDPNNEQGFQIEINYAPDDYTSFQANYGLTRTLPPSSYYKRIFTSNIPAQKQFEEFFIQGEHEWEDKLYLMLALGINTEAVSSTKNFAPVGEIRYYLDAINTLRLSLEHQQTHNTYTDEKYFNDVAMLEFQHAPNLTISLMSEMQTTEPEKGKRVRRFWNFIQLAYKLGEQTDVSILIGSRHAGHICLGGVCRYEPEFNGIELKMLTRIY